MKILYGIQGTGNGHLSRAMEIIPILKKKGDVDILLSGLQSELDLPFHVEYKFNGLYFVFGKKGGIDYVKTYLQSNTLRLLREIKSIPIRQYDLVISDFEPVTAWACNLQKLPCVSLCNQNAVLHPLAPKPKKTDHLGKFILEHYAPATEKYGFHFTSFDKSVFTPIIRKQVREMTPTDEGHYTVYLPAYEDERVIKHLKRFKDVSWQVFSKHNNISYRERNVSVFPVQHDKFVSSMVRSSGVLTAAGFGTASEALFLKKKLLVIPQKAQYEQKCNGAVLKSMGVPIMKSLKKKHHEVLEEWLKHGSVVPVNYPDQAEQLIDTIIENHFSRKEERKENILPSLSFKDIELGV